MCVKDITHLSPFLRAQVGRFEYRLDSFYSQKLAVHMHTSHPVFVLNRVVLSKVALLECASRTTFILELRFQV